MIQVNRIYLIFNRLVTKKFLVDTSDTSTEDSSYKEVGKYKIDGNKLYEMYSDEEEWIINDILLLNSMTLSVQELEADGVTPTGQKYSYQRVE